MMIDTATSSRASRRSEGEVLARAVTAAFAEWQLGNADQLILLGLARNNRMALTRYARGEALGANRDLRDRAGHLLGIWKSLKLLYPHNKELRGKWITSPNAFFGDHRPIDIVDEFGLPGLVIVRGKLDMMRGQ